jgi:hypothetical protein
VFFLFNAAIFKMIHLLSQLATFFEEPGHDLKRVIPLRESPVEANVNEQKFSNMLYSSFFCSFQIFFRYIDSDGPPP